MSKPFENLLTLAEPTLAAVRVIASPEVRPEAARGLLDEQIRALRVAAEREHVPSKDVDDVIYALAAYADEVMLARPATREAWLPRMLQLALFAENNAGEGFFVRLDALRRDPTRGEALLVYYVVLALGLRGRYASRDAARSELLENVHLDLLRAGSESEEALAPSAIPPRARAGASIDPRWAMAVGLSAVVLATTTWTLFALDLWLHAGRVLGS